MTQTVLQFRPVGKNQIEVFAGGGWVPVNVQDWQTAYSSWDEMMAGIAGRVEALNKKAEGKE